jgi:RNA polymerase sigma factor (sigma-70 family)
MGMTRDQQVLAEDNLGLVPYFINRMGMGGKQDWDDLVQAGRIGLMQAVVKFEPEQGNTFATYAAAWIRNAVRRESDKQNHPGSTHMNMLDNRLQQVTQAELEGKLMRHPTRDEVAEVVGDQVADINLTQLMSIEHNPYEEDFAYEGPWIATEDTLPALFDDLEQLDYLEEHERALLVAHGMGYTMIEIAKATGVIPETVSIRLNKLKKRLELEL